MTLEEVSKNAKIFYYGIMCKIDDSIAIFIKDGDKILEEGVVVSGKKENEHLNENVIDIVKVKFFDGYDNITIKDAEKLGYDSVLVSTLPLHELTLGCTVDDLWLDQLRMNDLISVLNQVEKDQNEQK